MTAGVLLEANAIKVIPLERAKDSAAELIAPTAMINSTPALTPFATNSQPIRPDRTTIFASKLFLIDEPIALSNAL